MDVLDAARHLLDGRHAATAAPIPASARPYQLLMQAGSAANRMLLPNPARLGYRETDVEAARQRAGTPPHPRPVVVIGGYASSSASLEPLAASLRADGVQQVYVFEVPANGLADLHDSAGELGRFIARVKAATGAGQVDIVAHSAGGVVATTWAQLHGGAGELATLVTIASPHNGIVLWNSPLLSSLVQTRLGAALLGASTAQLQAGSDLMRALAATREALRGVRLVSIRVAGYDGLLTPVDTAVVPGAVDVVLDPRDRSLREAGLGHFTLHRRSDRVYAAVHAALREGGAPPAQPAAVR